jgi:hypothetical protein
MVTTLLGLGAWFAISPPPASAIAPPQPATCAFTVDPGVVTDGAAGSVGLIVGTEPAVPWQNCSVTLNVNSRLATNTIGVAAGAIANDPLNQTVTLTFAPGRLPPNIAVFWEGACTSTAGPVYLITHAAGDRVVSSTGTWSSCVDKGGSSALLPLSAPEPSQVGIAPAPGGAGYRQVDQDGNVAAEGTPALSAPNPGTNAPVVGIAASSAVSNGDWVVASDGGVFSYGSAVFQGSEGSSHLNKPIVGMAADSATGGYWLVAADGGIFSFNAPFYGSTGSITLNAPIVGMAATPDGKGYWLVAADGGIFSYGDAHFYGSAGSIALNSPIVGIAADPRGGYWSVAADGGIFSYGAPFYGSAGSIPLNAPISSMAATPDGGGYWLAAADGGIFAYGDAHFYGKPLP